MIRKLIGAVVTSSLISVISIGCSNKNVENNKVYETINNKDINIESIKGVLKDKLPQDIELKDNIEILDLDNDGKLECIVSYINKKENRPLRILILSMENDRWVFKNEIKNVGENFDKVLYKDITNDGKLEIVAGFKGGENLSKGISIYEYEKGDIKEIFRDYYSNYLVKDVASNGNPELILMKKEDSGEILAELYEYKDSKILKLKETHIKNYKEAPF